MNSNSRVLTQSNATFMSRVYFWMMLGLAISGAVAFGVTSSEALTAKILGNSFIVIALIILQLGAVITISAFINKISATATTLLYLGYAALSGVTFGIVLLAFTKQSVAQAFFITSFAFIGLSSFGYITKRDLGPLGTFCMTGLFGLIGFMLVGLIFPSIMSNAVTMTMNAAAIIIFAGLTAWDTQKIKNFNVGFAEPEVVRKATISGALMLYLDFINLFISILNIFGDRR